MARPSTRIFGPPYRDQVTALWADTRIWDYLHYDDEGQLWINELRVIDAIRRYGAPLEIVDATLIERRCAEWMQLTRSVAHELCYPGRLDYLYAAKANMASEVTHAAYRSGWGAECSSAQDLRHLEWLAAHDLLPAQFRVVCNGFKLPPECYAWPEPTAGDRSGQQTGRSRVVLPADGKEGWLRPYLYTDRIIYLARHGWRIKPILDRDELPYFAARSGPPMDVGLRLRCGPASTLEELDGLPTRFGMDRHEVASQAAEIDRLEHLTLATLHTMVGSAEGMPVESYVKSLLLAARVWAELRVAHPTLRELNVGGGIPPLGEPYPHRRLVKELLSGLLGVAAEFGVPPPDVTFELGSLVAAEAGFHVFKVVQRKPSSGGRPPWAIVDVGLMAAIPDMLILGRPFRFLAVNGAQRPAEPVIFGDLTCDNDGRYPPKAFGPEAEVLLPIGEPAQFVLIQGVGAYQEILAGVRGAHHCGLLEAMELILERRRDGLVHGRLLPRQTPADAATILGYLPETAAALHEVGTPD